MLDRLHNWLATGPVSAPRNDVRALQDEAAKIRAEWSTPSMTVAASTPQSLVPVASTPPQPGGWVCLPSTLPPGKVVHRGTGGASFSIGHGHGNGGGVGGIYINNPGAMYTPTGVHIQTHPVDPIYRIPPTQQWREQYYHALSAAQYARVVVEE